MRVIFDEVSLWENVGIPCNQCGKKATKKIKVSQTVNPFNKNSTGFPKSRSEIMDENRIELLEEISSVVKKGRICRKCEADNYKEGV